MAKISLSGDCNIQEKAQQFSQQHRDALKKAVLLFGSERIDSIK
jgi:hypothetical protein